MLYMVIEHFHEGAAPEVYKRFRECGRSLHHVLTDVPRCNEPTLLRFCQVMQWDDPAVFAECTAKWTDLMEFEAIPVITSAEAQEIMRGRPEE
jgi:hypothetical protein